MITLMLDGKITTMHGDEYTYHAIAPYLAPGVVMTHHEEYSRVEVGAAAIATTDAPPPASKPARATKAAKADVDPDHVGMVREAFKFLVEPANLAEIAAASGLAPATVSACLTALGPEIVKSGRARGTRYALASAGDKAAE